MLDLPVHSKEFRIRRFLNWFPLGLAYAFLYMGRYNLTVLQSELPPGLIEVSEFGLVSSIGSVVYGCSFIISGPLTDRIGGRAAMLLSVMGILLANIAMGVVLWGVVVGGWSVSLPIMFGVLYPANMFFQSFGAIAIVTTKAPWFHVRERGTFSTIFGWMIALGIYFAFDWGYAIAKAVKATADSELSVMAEAFHWILPLSVGQVELWWLFFTPAAILGGLWVLLFLFLRNTPGEAGHTDFATGEASITAAGEKVPAWRVFYRLFTHPVLIFVCGVEFCSGVLRNGVMQWYRIFAKATGNTEFFVYQNWGFCLLLSGLLGAGLTGWASDRFFQARRGPMAAICYGFMLIAAFIMIGTIDGWQWGMSVAVLAVSTAVIGVHGIMSGTATADFGGAKNTGIAVGLVDGLVYLGVGLQFLVIGYLAPTEAAAKDPANWAAWPMFLVPFAGIGFFLATRIWNARPTPRPQVVPPADQEAA